MGLLTLSASVSFKPYGILMEYGILTRQMEKSVGMKDY